MLIKRPIAKPQSGHVSPKVVAPPNPPSGGSSVRSGRKAAKENGGDKEQRSTKSVTTRMPPDHLEMLDECVTVYESDRTEVIKRAIRLLNTALCAHNSSLTVIDGAGKTKEIHLVIDGVPT